MTGSGVDVACNIQQGTLRHGEETKFTCLDFLGFGSAPFVLAGLAS